jgi:hypothetical protein
VLISRLIDFLETRANLRIVVVLVMAIIPINALVFPLINETVSRGSGLGRVDSLFFISPLELFARLNSYGQSSRQAYVISIAAVEFLYPILYALLFGFLLTIVLRAGFPPAHYLRSMQLFPFGMLVFNYIGSISLALLLLLFPAQPISLAWIFSAANTLKWCFGIFSALALLVGVGRLLLTIFKPDRPHGE